MCFAILSLVLYYRFLKPKATLSRRQSSNAAAMTQVKNTSSRADPSSEHFNSQFKSTPPLALAVFRGTVLLILVSVQIYQYGRDGPLGPLIYFTVWNFHLCILVFALSFYGSVRNLKGNSAPSSSQPDRVLDVARLALQVELPSLLLVVLVTWSVLLPSVEDKSVLLNTTSYFQHGINAVFLLIEFAINSTKFKTRDVALLIAWPTLYGVFHMVYTGIFQHYAVYFFLDMTTHATIVAFLALLLVHTCFFFLCQCFGRAKKVDDEEAGEEEEAAESGGVGVGGVGVSLV
jgi:hypothetical protein